MLEKLKQEVLLANRMLPENHLVTLTWGNVSGIDRESGLFVIKPSGVPYDQLRAEDMVVMDLTGRKVEGELNPSSDAPTHMALYREFPQIGGVVHTHSRWATIWAQARREIPAYGTTHADTFHGPVPLARPLTAEEIDQKYELASGEVICEAFREKGIEPMHVPAALLPGHGPFTWGKNARDAVMNAIVLEEVAMMAWHTEAIGAPILPLQTELLEKHFMRKHGPNAYYGQKGGH